MAGKYDVYVYHDPQDDKFKVRPGVVFETPKTVVKFRNLVDPITQGTVTLTFPPGLIKDYPNGGTTQQIGKTANFQIDDNAADFYDYQVTVTPPFDKPKKAYGGSDPGMIIDA